MKLLAVLCLGCLTASAAQAFSGRASASVGGFDGPAGPGLPFDVVCTDGPCFDSVFGSSLPLAPAAVSGSFAAGGITFSGAGSATLESLNLLRARSEFRVAGPPSLPKVHRWFVNAGAGYDAEFTALPEAPALLGTAGSIDLAYRFEGTTSGLFVGDVTLSTGAFVVVATDGGQFSCTPDPADAGLCTVADVPVVFGDPFAFALSLQTFAEAEAGASSPDRYAANVDVDYSHTLELIGATFRDAAGAALTGPWQLQAEGGAYTLLTSPVPEPPAALMLALGLAALGWRRRYST